MASRELSTIVCCDSYNIGYTLYVSTIGDVYSLGNHDEGGHGHEDELIVPTRLTSLKNIEAIDCGYGHTICLDNEGRVFSFGSNLYGQLGIGKNYNSVPYTHLPQLIDISPVKQISCGGKFSICLSLKNELYSFGDNRYGQLGIGNTDTCDTPHKIKLEDIQFVQCGGFHAHCKSINNVIYSWGRNNHGQLGIGNSDNQNIPILCDVDNVVDIKCGTFHSIILNSSCEILSCGRNDNGQLGREGDGCSVFNKIENIPEILTIGCGDISSMCLDSNHNFYFFNHNFFIFGHLLGIIITHK